MRSPRIEHSGCERSDPRVCMPSARLARLRSLFAMSAPSTCPVACSCARVCVCVCACVRLSVCAWLPACRLPRAHPRGSQPRRCAPPHPCTPSLPPARARPPAPSAAARSPAFRAARMLTRALVQSAHAAAPCVRMDAAGAQASSTQYTRTSTRCATMRGCAWPARTSCPAPPASAAGARGAVRPSVRARVRRHALRFGSRVRALHPARCPSRVCALACRLLALQDGPHLAPCLGPRSRTAPLAARRESSAHIPARSHTRLLALSLSARSPTCVSCVLRALFLLSRNYRRRARGRGW
jgi:hypothetical protein